MLVQDEEEEEPFLGSKPSSAAAHASTLHPTPPTPSSSTSARTPRVRHLALLLHLGLLLATTWLVWREGGVLAASLGTVFGGALFSALSGGGARHGRSTPAGPCNLRTCQARFFVQGSWHHDPTRPRPEAQYSFGGGNSSEPPPAAQYDWLVLESSSNEEEYSCCPPVAHPYFDVPAFCTVLQDLGIGSMLVVGDSISQQMAMSLYLMVEGTRPNPERSWDPYNPPFDKGFPDTFSLCGGLNPTPTQVTLVRNDLLYVNETYIDAFMPEYADVGPYGDGGFWEWSHSKPWTPFLHARDVDLLILNTGAHIHQEPLYQRCTDIVLDYLERHYLTDDDDEAKGGNNKKKRLIFRSTNPGHPACMTYDGPTAPEKEWNYDNVAAFSWQDHAAFNNYTQTALAARFPGQVGWLDSATLTRDRPDGHFGETDCLHYTCPGPVDAWNVALLHMLETERAFGSDGRRR